MVKTRRHTKEQRWKKNNFAQFCSVFAHFCKTLQIFCTFLHFFANFCTFIRIFARVFCDNISSSKIVSVLFFTLFPTLQKYAYSTLHCKLLHVSSLWLLTKFWTFGKNIKWFQVKLIKFVQSMIWLLGSEQNVIHCLRGRNRICHKEDDKQVCVKVWLNCTKWTNWWSNQMKPLRHLTRKHEMLKLWPLFSSCEKMNLV